MVKNKEFGMTKELEFKDIPNRIVFRTKDVEVKNAILFIMQYCQFKSFSEVVRQSILEYFRAIKVRDAKQEELQRLADLYDLKVVSKYKRGQ